MFIFRANSLPPQIPLFYSRSDDELQIAETWMIIILPFLMNTFFFLNHFLLRNIFKNDQVILKIINFFNLFLLVSFSFAFARIIFIVT
ncbi:MAG: hypothetical protein NZL96_00850 [Patescibacteria group bacterium]|nr:hypothetical protein [Patescibacteria group bacterium]